MLPDISNGVKTLDSNVKSQLGAIETTQRQSEINIRDDLKQLRAHLINFQSLQDALSETNSKSQAEWQKELQISVQGLADCTKAQLDLLLKEAEKKEISPAPGRYSFVARIPAVVGQALQLVGNGIAGAIGTYVALNLTRENSIQDAGHGRQNAYRGSSMASLSHYPQSSSANSRGRADEPAFYQLYSTGAAVPVYNDARDPRTRRF